MSSQNHLNFPGLIYCKQYIPAKKKKKIKKIQGERAFNHQSEIK